MQKAPPARPEPARYSPPARPEPTRYSQPARVWCDALVHELRRGSIALWEHNRIVSEDRVCALASALEASRDPELLGPLPIILARLPNGSTYVLDGQHRISALARVDTPGRFCAFVCDARVPDFAAMAAEFERVNCGTPVPPAYWDDKTRHVLAEFLARLRLQWPRGASDSLRPIRPRYCEKALAEALSSVDGLRDAIRDGLGADDLFAAAAVVGEYAKRVHFDAAPPGARDRALKIAETTGFYLGLENKWPTKVVLEALDAAERKKRESMV
jgi:hypothetical protein